MKRISVFLVITTLIIFISCEKDDDHKPGLQTLNGTWKLTKYIDSNNDVLLEEPVDDTRPIALIFKDDSIKGKFSGHTVTNEVNGEYDLLADNKMTISNFVGTKINEPEWGSEFWEAITTTESYYVDSEHMKLFYDNGNKYMLFERADNYFSSFYWDQTKCADPWNTGENDSNDKTIDSLNSYLNYQGIYIYDIYFENGTALDTLCKSCKCGSGQRIFITGKKIDITKLTNLGFFQVLYI